MRYAPHAPVIPPGTPGLAPAGLDRASTSANPRPRVVRAGFAAAFAGCAVLLLTGCGAGSGAETLKQSGPTLGPADFFDASAEVVEVTTGKPMLAVTSANTVGPFSASEGLLDVTAFPGTPDENRNNSEGLSVAAGRLPTARALQETGAVAGGGTSGAASEARATLVDVKVGDINGKPVYANAFLDDIADQLKAQTSTLRRDEWRTFAKEQIETKLTLQIRDELLRAEAVSNFSPEQRQGFFSFMRGVQQRVESQNQGSRAATDARLEATEGMSLDQYMRKREQEELIGFQLREKIDKRVSIPWRDIKQEYDRYFDTFNPAPRARFRLIQVANESPAALAAFEAARANGVAPAEIAADKAINRYKPQVGGLEEREIKGDRATATLFGNEALNTAARTMAVGELVGPIAVGETVSFLFLEAVVEKSRTLYEAQMDIESVLRRRRSAEATERYIANLRARAVVSSTQEMTRELLAVATARFWPTTQP